VSRRFYSYSSAYGPTPNELIGPVSRVTPNCSAKVSLGKVRKELSLAMMVLTVLTPIGVGPLAVGLLDRVTGLFSSTASADVRTPSITAISSAIPISSSARLPFPSVGTPPVNAVGQGAVATATPASAESPRQPVARPSPPAIVSVE